MSGWFLVARKGLDHDFFERSPVTEWEAWTRLIARAAWEDTKHRIGGKSLPVKRGSFYCTLRGLRREFMWASDKRVRGLLDRLEGAGMIARSAEHGKTHVTICNYDKYQVSGRSEDASGTQVGTQAGTQASDCSEKGKDHPGRSAGRRLGRTKERSLNNIPVGTADAASLVFSSGVALLSAAGKSEGQARSIIGKWRKDHTDEAVIAALGEAQRAGAVDPVSFITACLFRKGRRETEREEAWNEWV